MKVKLGFKQIKVQTIDFGGKFPSILATGVKQANAMYCTQNYATTVQLLDERPNQTNVLMNVS